MAREIADFTGLVISRQSYRESDLLVKMLTDQFGKLTFLLNRARKPGFRFAAGILPFTLGIYVGDIRRPGLSFISAVKEARQYQNISQDIMLNAYASYILALIDLAFPEGELLGPWFDKAQQSLTLIDGGQDPQVVTNISEIQLLHAFGVEPHWRDCVICHRTDLPFDFSERYGGVLCQQHWHLDDHRYHLSARSIYWLRLFSAIKLDQVNQIDLKAATKLEMQVAIDRMYDNMVGVTPKAKRFLDQMKKDPGFGPQE
ncbi:DNA repair protein RecO [Lacticaseibacillus brantae]|uniref:DNA repair protein RecO n=1 Tax=Lacticaseibacillus brantae DSM 23927 TaxID=1423727 RepID=A0A0R2B8I9_9LACO|nr:DNA repair protein RecO [Lacticaseibacillus brantae]KRM72697.1 DNA repair protein recO [Lacticaseibacillus brantae DSM 23927]